MGNRLGLLLRDLRLVIEVFLLLGLSENFKISRSRSLVIGFFWIIINFLFIFAFQIFSNLVDIFAIDKFDLREQLQQTLIVLLLLVGDWVSLVNGDILQQ